MKRKSAKSDDEGKRHMDDFVGGVDVCVVFVVGGDRIRGEDAMDEIILEKVLSAVPLFADLRFCFQGIDEADEPLCCFSDIGEDPFVVILSFISSSSSMGERGDDCWFCCR